MNQQQDSNRTLVLGLSYTEIKNKGWEPFSAVKMYQAEVARRLSTDMRFSTATNIQGAVEQLKSIKPAILFISPRWNIGCDEIKHLIQASRSIESIKKTVFVDTCDATSTPYLPLLADVDLFVKPYLFRDTSLYLREFVGGHIFADFLVKKLGWEINGWHFGSCAKKEQLGKLRVGWSYGVSRRYRALANLAKLVPMPWALRRTDVNRRFCPVQRSVQEWYEQYRDMVSKKVEQIGGQFKISGYERVRYSRYFLELMTSKIALSPFGWGEVCIRDYEAVACGALLMKPDVSHLSTRPDIFKANETYVSIKWDLSDLAEKIDYYLSHPGDASRIAEAGHQSLLKYFKQNEFLEDFKSYLPDCDGHTAQERDQIYRSSWTYSAK
jgi:hypothetical protein